MACALPEVEWLEYSFQNFDHLVDQPIEIRDGWAYAPDRPGHGLVLSETARRDWSRPNAAAEDGTRRSPVQSARPARAQTGGAGLTRPPHTTEQEETT